MSNTNEYWWHQDAKYVASNLDQMRKSWQTYGSNPIYQAWVRNMVSYYSTILEPTAWDSSISYMGEQGELVRMLIPQARSLIRQMVAMITKQRLAFTCTAESQNSDVVKDTRLGNELAKDIIKEQMLDNVGATIVENALVFGMGFYYAGWRTDRGELYTTSPEGGLLYDGRLDVCSKSVFDVTYDANIEKWEDQPWCEAKTIKNRWDLIAQFPHLEQQIKALPSLKKMSATWTYEQTTYTQDDLVFIMEAYHKPSPALPRGRLVVFGSPDCVLYDDFNPYGCIPIIPMIPEQVYGMQYGYAMLSNLLPAQEFLDHSFSAIATNQAAFAVQNIVAPRASGLSAQDLGGMNWIGYTPQNVPGGGKPEALQLCASSPETFKFINELRSHMLELSGVNSALRGSPPPGVTAGTAIATLTQNALEFMSSYDKGYTIMMENGMNLCVNIKKKFIKTPHTINVQSKNGVSFSQEYTGEDLTNIKGYSIQRTNPLMNTIAGRSDIAEKLLAQGLIKTSQEYFSVLEGEPVQSLYKTELSSNDLVTRENEWLMSGKPVIVLRTDKHADHINGHLSLLNDPQVRESNGMVSAILDHIAQHSELGQNGDPYLTAIINTGKAPEPQMIAPPPPMLPPGGPAAPPGEMSKKGTIPGQAEMDVAQPAKPTPDALGRAV